MTAGGIREFIAAKRHKKRKKKCNKEFSQKERKEHEGEEYLEDRRRRTEDDEALEQKAKIPPKSLSIPLA